MTANLTLLAHAWRRGVCSLLRAMKLIYALLCLAGIVLPYSQFGPWVLDHGLQPGRIFAELFSTRIGAFFGWDVIVSAVVLIVWIARETRRQRVPGAWLCYPALLAVGVSLALPLFLLLRERAGSDRTE